MIIAFSQSNKGLPLHLHKARGTCASCIHLVPSEKVKPGNVTLITLFFIRPSIHRETEPFVHTYVGFFKNTVIITISLEAEKTVTEKKY